MAAQQLYEMGFITYMRTDSLRIATVAQNEARSYIHKSLVINLFRLRQDSIRLKNLHRTHMKQYVLLMRLILLKNIKDTFKPDQFKLYRLIWQRFMASQMSDAIMDTVSAEITTDKYMLKASGSTVKLPVLLPVC